MRLNHEQFYYRFGIKTLSMLIKPVPVSTENFLLPLNSIVHFMSDDPDSLSREDLLLKGTKKLVFVNNVTELKSLDYAPRVIDRNINTKIAKFHKEHRDIRNTTNYDKLDPTSPLVFNYSYLEGKYEYKHTNVSYYYEWYNINKTVWINVAELSKTNSRIQYFRFNITCNIPNVLALNTLSKSINSNINKLLLDNEAYALLELWKWIDPDTRANSSMQPLVNADLSKIVLVITANNSFRLLNLGLLDNFNRDGIKPGKTALSADSLKKLLLRYSYTFESSTSQDTVVEEESSDEDIHDLNKDFDEIVANLDKDLEGRIKLSDVKAVKEAPVTDSEVDSIETFFDYDVDSLPDTKSVVSTSLSPADTYKTLLDDYADKGDLSVSEYKEALKLLEQFKNMPSPKDPKVKLVDYINITPEDIQFNTVKTNMPDGISIVDKRMLESNLQSFDSDYIGKILDKDIAGGIVQLMKAGVILTDYKVETVDTIIGAYEKHVIKVKPLGGKVATLHIKVPVFNERGEYLSGGNKYRQRKQRVDVPIRKVDSGKVSLTSYYGKVFVNRSEFKADDYRSWLVNQVTSLSYNETPLIRDLTIANVFDNYNKTPKVYAQLSKDFKSFSMGNYKLYFRKDLLEAELGKPVPELKGFYPVGVAKSGELIYIQFGTDKFFLKGNNLVELGSIESLLGLDVSRAPIEYATATIFATAVPVGFILSYLLGFKDLLKLLKVKPIVHTGKRLPELTDTQWVLPLKDAKLIFDRSDKVATMILYGLTNFEKSLKRYSLTALDNKDIYLTLLEDRNITTRYLRELEGQDKLFVDNITEQVLRDMKEPTTYRGLLIRSAELLTTEDYPDENDMKYARIRGYERIAGAVFKELNDSYRDFTARQIKNRNSMEMSPYATWGRISKDPTVMLVSDINPIENLKQQEAVTMTGEGGRSKGAISIDVREYHQNDLGIISEATVDSSDVSINTFLSANPSLANLRGIPGNFTFDSKGSSGLLSTTASSAIGAAHDSGKRTIFHSIHNSHTIGTIGYRQAQVRTGYESVIPHRVGESFCVTAKLDGKVTVLGTKGITVEYSDGTIAGYELGIKYGKSEGSMYPHEIVTSFTLGYKFKAGEAICYNKAFFEPDLLDPKRVVWKTAGTIRTALYESQQTFEDSSSISPKAASLLTAHISKTRSIVLTFDQAISRVVKVGAIVDVLDTLCIIEDEITAKTGMLDDETIDALKRLSDKTPKAKYKGEITKIEVFYHGDKTDMNPSLKSLADYSDLELKRLAKETNGKVYTGAVDSDYRVDGVPLAVDSLELRFYIKVTDVPSVGDKAVFSNQLKTTIGEVFEYPVKTEDGGDIEAIFGEKSLAARIVNSAYYIGSTTMLLKQLAKKAVEVYNK